MDRLITGMGGFCAAYLDDLVVYSESWEEHLHHLSQVLGCLTKVGLTAKPSKCQWPWTSVCIWDIQWGTG